MYKCSASSQNEYDLESSTETWFMQIFYPSVISTIDVFLRISHKQLV